MSARPIANICCASPRRRVIAGCCLAFFEYGENGGKISSIRSLQLRFGQSFGIGTHRGGLSWTLISEKTCLPSGERAIPIFMISSLFIPKTLEDLNRSSPLLLLLSPTIVFMSVLLPAPLAPTSETISPGRTWSETCLKA